MAVNFTNWSGKVNNPTARDEVVVPVAENRVERVRIDFDHNFTTDQAAELHAIIQANKEISIALARDVSLHSRGPSGFDQLYAAQRMAAKAVGPSADVLRTVLKILAK